MIERAHLNEGLGRTNAQLSERQRREQEISDQLATEREQSGKMKSELDRLQETVPPKPSRPPEQAGRPSILSFFLEPALALRGQGEPQQQITISREIGLIRLQIKIEKGDSQRFQAAIRTVEGAQVWNQRSLNPRSGAISVNVPANKLPLDDYILTLSALTSTDETDEVNRYFFRVIRK